MTEITIGSTKGFFKIFVGQHNFITKSIRDMLREILDEMSKDPNKLVNLETIIQNSMVKDRGLLGHFITEIAGPELVFIERSGLYFGFLFGLIQMTVWVIFPHQWVLPLGGLLVGWITNYLAVTLLFKPNKPKKIVPWEIQGVFIKRQKEVATKFANVMVDSVFTIENLTRETLHGAEKQPAMSMVEAKVNKALDKEQNNPILAHLFGKDMINDARADLMGRINTIDPANIKNEKADEIFQEKSQQIHNQINNNLNRLEPEEFNDIIRPVFKADEWKLIAAGAALGLVAGILQLTHVFADYVA